jgi:hypothetical protein
MPPRRADPCASTPAPPRRGGSQARCGRQAHSQAHSESAQRTAHPPRAVPDGTCVARSPGPFRSAHTGGPRTRSPHARSCGGTCSDRLRPAANPTPLRRAPSGQRPTRLSPRPRPPSRPRATRPPRRPVRPRARPRDPLRQTGWSSPTGRCGADTRADAAASSLPLGRPSRCKLAGDALLCHTLNAGAAAGGGKEPANEAEYVAALEATVGGQAGKAISLAQLGSAIKKPAAIKARGRAARAACPARPS